MLEDTSSRWYQNSSIWLSYITTLDSQSSRYFKRAEYPMPGRFIRYLQMSGNQHKITCCKDSNEVRQVSEINSASKNKIWLVLLSNHIGIGRKVIFTYTHNVQGGSCVLLWSSILQIRNQVNVNVWSQSVLYLQHCTLSSFFSWQHCCFNFKGIEVKFSASNMVLEASHVVNSMASLHSESSPI